jgi:tetratricopeptide (TPR) repeat protein
MRYIFAFVGASALLAGGCVAQEATGPKMEKPDLPAVPHSPVNASATDVPAVDQPKLTTPTKAATRTKPAASAKAPLTPPVTFPDELKSKVSIAMQQVKANQTVEAMALFTELLAAKPDLFTILVERGKLYQQTQDHAKAIADFTAAIAHRPSYVDAYFRRCLSHYETGSYPSAIADCTRAIELNDAPPEFHYYRGLAHTAMRAWDKAAADLTAATRRNNDHPDAHLQLARVYFEMDELIASLREYTIAIQQRPGFAAAYQGRSVVKLALGDSAGSHEDLGKIAR